MDNEDEVKTRMQSISEAESTGNYDTINRSLLQKRLGWYEANKSSLNLQGSDVRKAYDMVLFRYMKLNPDDVPVVYEDKKKIVWQSFNWCPILEACKRLNLDTREVCKKGWEESVQKMVEIINPKLRFSRNYKILRPHGKYCEETIELVE